MKTRSTFSALLVVLSLAGCAQEDRERTDEDYQRLLQSHPSLFKAPVPLGTAFNKEVSFLKKTGQISKGQFNKISTAIDKSTVRFDVPPAILWCLLYQESRFDVFRNATEPNLARGIGQFLQRALDELNEDPDLFAKGTKDRLNEVIKPEPFPIAFSIYPESALRSIQLGKTTKIPMQSKNSYYRIETGIAASAAYLNNRYRQLASALRKNKIGYHPDLLWLYAVAAYNKGNRAVFAVLNGERTVKGIDGLEDLLTNPTNTYSLLTDTKLLDYRLRPIWGIDKRRRYAKEMSKNFEMIYSCTFGEEK